MEMCSLVVGNCMRFNSSIQKINPGGNDQSSQTRQA